MRYALEIINLMAAYPGRDFRMRQLVNFVVGSRTKDKQARQAVRVSISRALDALEENGTVEVTPATTRGGHALYRWKEQQPAAAKVTHEPACQ